MKAWLMAWLLVSSGASLGAQRVAQPVAQPVAKHGGRTLQFSLDRVGPPLLQYTIIVAESGAGVYAGRLVAGALDVAGTEAGSRAIRVDAGVVKKLFAAVPMVEGGRCETHNKGIAKSGVKLLRYAASDRDAACTYNYSDDERVNDATSMFEAIAETMSFGERLASKLRFDRLGLDTELDGLQTAVAEGRAVEMGNIAPVLRAISDDDRVMERVRRKAVRLLQGVDTGQTAAGAEPSAR